MRPLGAADMAMNEESSRREERDMGGARGVEVSNQSSIGNVLKFLIK